MALILSIDTAMESALVCLASDGVPIHSKFNSHQKDHAGFLQMAIKHIMEETNFSLNNVDAIAVTHGPGSYTGLRVGLASAKGLCYALKKPLITLNTLEVIALSAIQSSSVFEQNPTAIICPMIDARRMEVFMAVFDAHLNVIVSPSAVILTSTYVDSLLNGQVMLFTGNSNHKIKTICDSSNAIFDEINITPKSISTLSHQSYVNQLFTNLAYSEPNYLKAFSDHSNKKNS